MHAIARFLLVIVVMALGPSCSSPRSSRVTYETLTMEAIQQFDAMRRSGDLPGLSKDEHGNVETAEIPENRPVIYPVGVTLHVSSKTKASRFGYRFTRDSVAARWMLASAWQTRANGQREPLPIERQE